MNFITKLFVILTIFITTNTFAQYGLMRPQNPNTAPECKQCKDALRKKPKEVHFSVKTDNDNIYFEVTQKEWLYSLFKDPKDGLLVDIVSKEQYNCSLTALSKSKNGIQGISLAPIFTKKIKSGLQKQANGEYRVKVGTIPEQLKNQELEFNIFFINDNYLCRYNRIYNLKSYNLQLLDMGMYLDSITYNSDIKKSSEINGYKIKYKTLQFTIPFEKNKASYSKEDVKPLYDSLNLTTYDIKKIHIKAYSSVEGSLDHNLELQSQRAQSIASAMQQFQTPKIETTISATENWTEFLNDIQNTEYASFADLSQVDIKSKLRQPDVNTALEPYLKNHRKAIILLELDKKDPYKDMVPDQLFKLFNDKIASKDIKEANRLQNIIFQRIKSSQISPDRITELGVPKQKEYVDFIIKNSSYKYMLNVREGMITYNQLVALDKLVPYNKKIKYNLCAIKFIIWKNKWQPVNSDALKQDIFALKRYGIPQILVDRMLVNFEILKAEAYMRKGDFKNKDKSTAYIFTRYKDKNLRDEDFLNLANYFARFSNHKYAKDLLKNKVQHIEVSEDLLFYYLNLTLIDSELTKKQHYRSMMLNGYSKNPERFCKLFNSSNKDGITFQLLENDFLRKAYCENCNK